MSANRFVPAEDRITKVIRESQRPGEEPWEKTWNGKRWEDMPTWGGYEMKLLDFALFRRGMYDPEFDAVTEEVDDESGEAVPRRTMNQRAYGVEGTVTIPSGALIDGYATSADVMSGYVPRSTAVDEFTSALTQAVGLGASELGLNLVLNAGSDSEGALLALREGTGNGTHIIGLQAPASVTGDITYVLPQSPASAGLMLTSGGVSAGVSTLTWQAVVAPAGTLTGTTLAANVVSSSLTSLGTIATGVWQGSIIAPAYLGTGTSITTKYLRGDGTWQTISGGGDALTTSSLDQFADVTQTATKTLAITESTTLAGGSHSGTNTGDQTITLTGDVTGSGTGSFAATIAAGSVALSDMADMATASVFYRKTAGTGAPEVQTLATLKTDLGLTGTNSGDQTTITGNAGSATVLATPRAIYGNNFDGSAALTQIIASTYGGTGNGFTKFTGPTTAERTFTLPDATSTILTSNDVVTVAQGGTGRATSTTAYGLLAAGTTATGAHQTLAAGSTT